MCFVELIKHCRKSGPAQQLLLIQALCMQGSVACAYGLISFRVFEQRSHLACPQVHRSVYRPKLGLVGRQPLHEKHL